ncbi:DUF2252 domain-containing protein [Williamsia sp. D3]|uniref:DUF2252 domain-containing protein n=1 Tax=Williamsia sp. D3 TaxID=1313067 RepID=UPI0003D33439|nr:DUF2252 domain-containing protein [Williamsia sp. D3]ETD31398.1 hypothetical protein W823_20220 [Williamsia sp. D3]
MTLSTNHSSPADTATPDPPRRGRDARHLVPRRELGNWDPVTRGHDPLQTILAQSAIRAPDLLPIRHGRMGHSPWTYYRGAAAVMAADLASTPHTGIMVQMCGDAHALNFGMWESPERNLIFDLRDFDETLPGPFEWDLKRFLASLVILARDNGLSDAHGHKAVRSGYRSYRKHIRKYSEIPHIDVWYSRIDVDQLLSYAKKDTEADLDAVIKSKAQTRTSRGVSRKLTQDVGGRRVITEDPPYRTHRLQDEAEAILREVMSRYYESVPDHLRALLSHYDTVDAVRQVVGVGSVGMRVFLTLLEEQRTQDPLFLQIKQAGPSVYEQYLGSSRYENHGARVVHGQRLIQSATDIFVGWTSFSDMDFYVRQFRDGKVIPKGAGVAPQLAQFAAACGHALARAHSRGGDAAAIVDYLGNSDVVEDVLVGFAAAYADQNAADHAQMAHAIENGDILSERGWSEIP